MNEDRGDLCEAGRRLVREEWPKPCSRIFTVRVKGVEGHGELRLCSHHAELFVKGMST